MKCGHCKLDHDTVTQVRECYGQPTNPTELVTPYASTAQQLDAHAYHANAKLAEPATAAQRSYIISLAEGREVPVSGTVETAMHIRLAEHLLGDPEYSMSKREASAAITWLRTLPISVRLEAAAKKAGTSQQHETVLEGRYAVETPDVVKFYKVDRPTEGKWTGYVFVKMLVGSPGDWSEYPIKGAAREAVFIAIESAGVRESAVLFGRKTQRCGRCMSPLSDPRSRAAGYGQHCASLLGWPYPSRQEALAFLGEGVNA